MRGPPYTADICQSKSDCIRGLFCYCIALPVRNPAGQTRNVPGLIAALRAAEEAPPLYLFVFKELRHDIVQFVLKFAPSLHFLNELRRIVRRIIEVIAGIDIERLSLEEDVIHDRHYEKCHKCSVYESGGDDRRHAIFDIARIVVRAVMRIGRIRVLPVATSAS